MTPDVITVAGEAPLQEIMRIMEERRIKRVPVVGEGKIVGIVGRCQSGRRLFCRADATVSRSIDEAIRKAILAELDERTSAPRSMVNVIVRNGVAGFGARYLTKRT